jgi:hypothetical protein
MLGVVVSFHVEVYSLLLWKAYMADMEEMSKPNRPPPTIATAAMA